VPLACVPHQLCIPQVALRYTVLTHERAMLVRALQQFNHTGHDFEIRLDRDSVVEAVDDQDAAAIPKIVYNVSE